MMWEKMPTCVKVPDLSARLSTLGVKKAKVGYSAWIQGANNLNKTLEAHGT